MELTVGKIYKLTRKLGQGAFGEIYHAINTKNESEVAVKLEPVKTSHPQLFYEAKLLAYLNNNDSTTELGIPQVYYSNTEGEYNLMVMELLGPSLEELFTFCDRRFDLKSTLMAGLQLMDRIEYVHSKKFLHRDIKPDNFLIGNERYYSGSHGKSNLIYLIDFGLAKKYIGKDGKHIPYRDNKLLTGTARYASLNTHIGIEQGRRDDIESLAYVLIYFLKGALPWQNLKANNKKEKYERIMEKKLAVTVDVLCKGLPKQFEEFLNESRRLYFDSEPDYSLFKNLLRGMLKQEGYENDSKFCWAKAVHEHELKKISQG